MSQGSILLSEERCRRHGWWFLLLLTALLYVPGTGTMPLMDRDEPRFANATVEMMERGTWTVPYFNGEYRFDKPPLTYWWMRLHYWLTGTGELGARLHSVVAAYLAALVIGGLVRRVTGASRAGLIAGLMWLTTVQVLIHGRLCVADMPMILCVTLACRALLELLVLGGGKTRVWWWVLWLSLGFGFLAKGPIVWLVPGLTLLLWRFAFWRKPVVWRNLRVLPGLAVMMLPVAAWGVPALIETNGLFWEIGMGRHVVKRGVEVLNGRKFIPGYYLLTTWLSLFPWLFFIMPVWRMLRARWTAELTFLATWFVLPQILFSFYATQLPHYVMPGYPAFIALLAVAWSGREPQDEGVTPPLAKWGVSIMGGLIALIFISTRLVPIGIPDLKMFVCSTSALLLWMFVFGGMGALFAWRACGSWRWIMPIFAVLGSATCLLPFSQSLRQTSVTLQVSRTLDRMPAETQFFGSGYDEPSLVFYTQKRWEMGAKIPAIRQQMEVGGPCAAVLLRREWTLEHEIKSWMGQKARDTPAKDRSKEVDALIAAFPNAETHVITGFNGARSSWTEVVVLSLRR